MSECEARMTTMELSEMVSQIISNMKPAIPIDIDLWDIATIAKFLKRNDAVVRERIACLPDFPKAIRLPSLKGLGRPLYKAAEVIAWAEKYRDA